MQTAAHEFVDACAAGLLKQAQDLLLQYPNINKCKIKTNTEVFLARELAFIDACLCGQLHVAQWLYSVFKEKYTIHVNMLALDNACTHKQINIIKWLVSLDNSIFINNSEMFKCACKDKQLNIAEIFRRASPFKYLISIKFTDERHVRTTIRGVVNTGKNTKTLAIIYMFCKKGYTPTPTLMFILQFVIN